MPKFYLIDESLSDVGGHHHGFARLVADAATQFGYDVVLATHRWFDGAGFSRTSQTWPLYPHRLYDDPFLMPCGETGLGHVRYLANCAERARRWRYASRRRCWIAQHAAATIALFKGAPANQGDQVFFAAASEATLGSLATAARYNPLPAADYHFLFHFNPFAGSPSDYPRQTLRRRRYADAFHRLERVLPAEKLHYFTTTEELTDQFDRIVPGRVVTLGYPLDPAVGSFDRADRGGPLRIVFAGDARLEKGYQHLPAIVDALAPELVAGRAQFIVQSNFPFKLPCRRRNLPLVAAREHLARYPAEQVTLIADSLAPADYRSLIEKADIGVLPYDSIHYYARCSGVILEMLARPAPVVVPAGGWMARQVESSGAGLVASSIADFPRQLRKILRDYDHYTQAAARHAADLARRRHPRKFMADLLSHSAALAPPQRSHAA